MAHAPVRARHAGNRRLGGNRSGDGPAGDCNRRRTPGRGALSSGGTLAIVAAFLFALAATLQQKGALNLPEVSLKSPKSLAMLAAQKMWLVGTLALLAGYLFQA